MHIVGSRQAIGCFYYDFWFNVVVVVVVVVIVGAAHFLRYAVKESCDRNYFLNSLARALIHIPSVLLSFSVYGYAYDL